MKRQNKLLLHQPIMIIRRPSEEEFGWACNNRPITVMLPKGTNPKRNDCKFSYLRFLNVDLGNTYAWTF